MLRRFNAGPLASKLKPLRSKPTTALVSTGRISGGDGLAPLRTFESANHNCPGPVPACQAAFTPVNGAEENPNAVTSGPGRAEATAEPGPALGEKRPSSPESIPRYRFPSAGSNTRPKAATTANFE